MDAADGPLLSGLLTTQHSVLAHAQARACGLSRDFLHWRVGRGRWQRPLPRVYVAHSGPLTDQQRMWAAWAYCYPDGVLSCHTAAVLHGLRGYADDVVHVSVPVGRQPRRRPGLRIHETRHLGPDQVHPGGPLPRTRIERSLVDMAAHARTIDHAVAVLAAGVQQRLTTGARLESQLLTMATTRWRGLLLDVCGDLAGGSHSVIEVEAARLFRRYGLPAPDRQLALTLPDRLARVDCCWDAPGVGR